VNDPAEPPRRSIDADIDYLLSRLHPKGHPMRYRTDNPLSGRWIGTPPNANLRVSDAERNEVAERLSRHFAEGRLDQTEFKERLDAAMSAKTQGDLGGLFDDLPRLTDEPAPPPSRRRRAIPLVMMVAIVVLAAGSAFSFVHVLQIPWLLIAVVAFFIWHRTGHRRHFRR
jgi:hypothetical protein